MTDKNFDLEKLAELYPDAAKELLSYTQALDSKLLQKEGSDDFITYIKHMWPDFVQGEHHKIFAKKSFEFLLLHIFFIFFANELAESCLAPV